MLDGQQERVLHWERLAYATEFLVAIPAILYSVGEIGGQAHMDLMPWYWKLPAAGLMALAWTRLTAAMVEGARAWNGRSRGWAAALAVLCGLMGLGLYYLHTQESTSDPDSDEGSAAAMCVRGSVWKG